MTLTEFLLARIAEDEAAAMAAAWDGHSWIPEPCHVARSDTDVCVTTFASDAVHIARHDPPRVLRECIAKRRIVKIHTEGLDDFDGSELYSTGCDGCNSALWPCPTILALSLPYADYPDYLEEWKP